jgi:hypothetical protein
MRFAVVAELKVIEFTAPKRVPNGVDGAAAVFHGFSSERGP